MTTRSSGNPQHPTCIDITTHGQPPGSEWLCGPDCPPHAKPAVTTYDEWRVTGTWPEDGKPFDVQLWRSDQCNAEAEARKWAEWARATGVTDGPHLHKRTVTVTDWEAVE